MRKWACKPLAALLMILLLAATITATEFAPYRMAATTPLATDTTPPPTNYVLSFQGYDFDGANEETITLNGNFVTSIPSVLSPQNGGMWIPFTVSIPVSFIIQGMNNLVFTHANSDCLYEDGVRNLQLLANNTVILSDATAHTLNCTTPVSYNFIVSPTVVGWGGVRLDESQANSANPPSQVFSGEAASNMELQVQRLQSRGF